MKRLKDARDIQGGEIELAESTVRYWREYWYSISPSHYWSVILLQISHQWVGWATDNCINTLCHSLLQSTESISSKNYMCLCRQSSSHYRGLPCQITNVTGCRNKNLKMKRSNRKRNRGESRGQMGELACTWHTLHGSMCMCVTHNSGNYLSRWVHRGLGSIGDGGVLGGAVKQ